MKTWRWRFQAVLGQIIVAALAAACRQTPAASPSHPKSTAEERALLGVGVAFAPAPDDGDTAAQTLAASESARRRHGWDLFQTLTGAVNVPGLDGKTVPAVQTWYSKDEVARLFASFYATLSAPERAAGRPASPAQAAAHLAAAATDRTVGGWDQSEVIRLAEALKQDPSSAGVGPEDGDVVQVLFSPAFVAHVLTNFGKLGACTDGFVDRLPTGAGEEPDPMNFAPCLDAEFPRSAAMVKIHWQLQFPGAKLAVFASDDASMARTLAAQVWNPSGSVDPATLAADRIHTINVPATGRTYRMASMHIVTKETREWFWSSFWWSDAPALDFGADRPAGVAATDPAWGNYKMCATVGFDQGDADPAAAFRVSQPTLAAALDAVKSAMGGSTWCSNPYVEQAAAATNCVACHQKAPKTSQPIIHRARNNFPSDFNFSTRSFRQAIQDVLTTSF